MTTPTPIGSDFDLATAIARHDVDRSAPYGLYVVGPDDPIAMHGRLLERAVFFEAFGNTPELLAEEYGRYESSSVWAVVVDHITCQPAGCIRFVCDGAGDLKSLTDIGREPWSEDVADVLERNGLADLDLSTTLDVATLAVAPEYRGRGKSSIISLALYQAVCRLSVAASMTHFIAILDHRVFQLVQRRTGSPFVLYDGVEPKRYLDSPLSIPCIADVEEYETRLRADKPDTAAMLFDGDGFESVIASPDWAIAGDLAMAATTRQVIDLRESADVHVGAA